MNGNKTIMTTRESEIIIKIANLILKNLKNEVQDVSQTLIEIDSNIKFSSDELRKMDLALRSNISEYNDGLKNNLNIMQNEIKVMTNNMGQQINGNVDEAKKTMNNIEKEAKSNENRRLKNELERIASFHDKVKMSTDLLDNEKVKYFEYKIRIIINLNFWYYIFKSIVDMENCVQEILDDLKSVIVSIDLIKFKSDFKHTSGGKTLILKSFIRMRTIALLVFELFVIILAFVIVNSSDNDSSNLLINLQIFVLSIGLILFIIIAIEKFDRLKKCILRLDY